MELLFAEYRPEQLKELVLMWRESFEHGVGVTDPNPIEQQERFFVEKLAPGNTLRVAMLDGVLVGFVAASPSSVAALYVRKGFHGRGIGSRFIEWAKAQSAGSLWLYAFARNTVARAFYEHHGFVATVFGHEPTWDLDDVRYEWKASDADSR
jgi:GNAT superfamily N-acetyltransferase